MNYIEGNQRCVNLSLAHYKCDDNFIDNFFYLALGIDMTAHNLQSNYQIVPIHIYLNGICKLVGRGEEKKDYHGL